MYRKSKYLIVLRNIVNPFDLKFQNTLPNICTDRGSPRISGSDYVLHIYFSADSADIGKYKLDRVNLHNYNLFQHNLQVQRASSGQSEIENLEAGRSRSFHVSFNFFSLGRFGIRFFRR